MQDYEKPLFGTSLGQAKSSEELELKVSQMLCLPVSAGELLQSNHAGGVRKEYKKLKLNYVISFLIFEEINYLHAKYFFFICRFIFFLSKLMFQEYIRVSNKSEPDHT